ncbi:MAG: alpha/beta hydrolase [Proteobacteria bacterium]|nr:alpha/beta hydrolase [Pseudomonadota bacterium]
MKILLRYSWVGKFLKLLEERSVTCVESTYNSRFGPISYLHFRKNVFDTQKTIVFLHGFGNDSLFPHAQLFTRLIDLGFNIVTSDLPGHGQGEHSTFEPDSFADFYNDLAQELTTKLHDLEKWHAMGYSIGACASADFALKNPSYLDSCCFLSMPVKLPTGIPIYAELLSPLHKGFRESYNMYGLIGSIPAIGSFRRNEFPIRIKNAKFSDHFSIAKSAIESLQLTDRIKDLTLRSICITGSLDKIAPMEFLRQTAANSKLIQLHEMPRENHYTPLFSDQVFLKITDFYKSNQQS